MGDLTAAIARRSQAIATGRATDYAAGNRLYDVVVNRPGQRPTFNRSTGAIVQLARQTVYTGKARVTVAAPGGTVDVGEETETYATVRVSIGSNTTLEPAIDDEVTIVANDFSRAAHVDGRVFRVIAVTVGGQLAVGYELTATGIAPSRSWERT